MTVLDSRIGHRPRVLVGWLVAVGAVQSMIVAVNLSPLIESYTLGSRFDLNGEATVPSWLSATLLMLVALAAAAVAAVERSRAQRLPTKRSIWLGWAVVAAVFVVLSVDEAASIHELIGELASDVLSVSWLPSLYTWVLVVGPVAAIGAIAMVRWVRTTLGSHNAVTRLISVAVGMWLLVPVLEALDPTLGGPVALVALEESLEVIGEALMVAALAWRLSDLGLPAAYRTMART